MKKTKILWVILALLAILLPFVSLTAFAIALPPQFSNTFSGRLNEKFDRLRSVEGEKIVVVGGSSVAFGLDSATLAQYTGKEVVNFGLYAALGTKLMLDLSKAGIRKGDVVILAPEIDPQTLSLYFSSENTLCALDDDFSMFFSVGADNWLSLLGGMWKFAEEKYGYYKDGAPDPKGVYNAKNFNEYGDVVYSRPKNTMILGYDPNTPIDLSEQTVSPDFIDYLNDYIRYCERKGATVYFSFCPMNASALAAGTTGESISAFRSYLSEALDCPVISDPQDYIMDESFFFDTNFHLNDAGVPLRTARLIRDYYAAAGLDDAPLAPLP